MSPPDRNSDVRPSSPRDGSATELVGGLITDAKDLVVAHGERIKLEVRDELHALKDTMKLVGIAVGAVTVASILVGHAIALGLAAASGLPFWASYAIVAIVAVIAGVLVLKRRPPTSQIDLVPEQSLRDVKRDAKMVANVVKS
jgi:hypothetical protein